MKKGPNKDTEYAPENVNTTPREVAKKTCEQVINIRTGFDQPITNDNIAHALNTFIQRVHPGAVVHIAPDVLDTIRRVCFLRDDGGDEICGGMRAILAKGTLHGGSCTDAEKIQVMSFLETHQSALGIDLATERGTYTLTDPQRMGIVSENIGEIQLIKKLLAAHCEAESLHLISERLLSKMPIPARAIDICLARLWESMLTRMIKFGENNPQWATTDMVNQIYEHRMDDALSRLIYTTKNGKEWITTKIMQDLYASRMYKTICAAISHTKIGKEWVTTEIMSELNASQAYDIIPSAIVHTAVGKKWITTAILDELCQKKAGDILGTAVEHVVTAKKWALEEGKLDMLCECQLSHVLRVIIHYNYLDGAGRVWASKPENLDKLYDNGLDSALGAAIEHIQEGRKWAQENIHRLLTGDYPSALSAAIKVGENTVHRQITDEVMETMFRHDKDHSRAILAAIEQQIIPALQFQRKNRNWGNQIIQRLQQNKPPHIMLRSLNALQKIMTDNAYQANKPGE